MNGHLLWVESDFNESERRTMLLAELVCEYGLKRCKMCGTMNGGLATTTCTYKSKSIEDKLNEVKIKLERHYNDYY